MQPLEQRPKRLIPFPGRRQAEGRKAVVRGKGQERREQRHDVRLGQVVLSQVVDQPVEPVGRRLVAAEAEKPLEEVDDRVEAAVLVVRRTTPFDDGRALCGLDAGRRRVGGGLARVTGLLQDMLLDRVHQPRLAQARLADEQHDLAHALLGLLPAVLQQADLVVAAGQRREPRPLRDLDGVEVLAESLHQEEFDGLRDPLDLAVAEAGAVEIAADQPVRGRGDDDLAGLGDVLQPDRHVAGLPHQ